MTVSLDYRLLLFRKYKNNWLLILLMDSIVKSDEVILPRVFDLLLKKIDSNRVLQQLSMTLQNKKTLTHMPNGPNLKLKIPSSPHTQPSKSLVLSPLSSSPRILDNIPILNLSKSKINPQKKNTNDQRGLTNPSMKIAKQAKREHKMKKQRNRKFQILQTRTAVMISKQALNIHAEQRFKLNRFDFYYHHIYLYHEVAKSI